MQSKEQWMMLFVKFYNIRVALSVINKRLLTTVTILAVSDPAPNSTQLTQVIQKRPQRRVWS